MSATPDWSQLATKQDLELQLRELRVSVREDMAGLRESILTVDSKIEGLKGSLRVTVWIPFVGFVILALLPSLQAVIQRWLQVFTLVPPS